MHRRRKSKEEGDLPNGFTNIMNPNGDTTVGMSNAHNGDDELQQPQRRQRYRVHSTPSRPASISIPPMPMSSVVEASNDISSPTRTQLPTHHRTRSISQDSSLPSPLSTSFTNPPLSPTAPTLSPTQLRRHSRIHSRNLSIYFPRPTLGVAPISEDAVQDIPYSPPSFPDASIPKIAVHSAPPTKKTFDPNFKFGGKPPSSASSNLSPSPLPGPSETTPGTRKRGHHHAHSLSHNFFSFLDPSSPPPRSDGSPASTPFSANFDATQLSYPPHTTTTSSFMLPPSPSLTIPYDALVFALGQFLLGALLWVGGQQCGSLSVTGLGYWVVFDSFGVLISRVLPRYLALPSTKSTARSYGNTRLETLALFAQAIYLVFAAVYIFKETLEHVLLSSHSELELESSAAGGHHHHHGDDLAIIAFPKLLIFLSTLSIISSSYKFETHVRLVDSIGNHMHFTFLRTLLPSQYRSRVMIKEAAKTPWAVLLTNPYSAPSLLFSVCLTITATLIPVRLHRPIDMLLATLQTVLTFSVAYPASVALGKVLLQTAPPRGLISGRMESFLRIMRELERHPDVTHTPPPHIWQLTTPSHSYSDSPQEKGKLAPEMLIITIKLFVSKDLDDQSILSMTRWTWERVTSAVGGPGVAEVTVDIRRDA